MANGDGLLHAHAAVCAYGADAGFYHGCGNGFRGCAHHGAVFVFAGVEGERGDYGQAGEECCCYGEACFFNIAHGLDEECIGAGGGERCGLRGKGGGDLVGGDLAGEEDFSGGTDGGEDQRRARSAARNFYAGAVDGVEISCGCGLHSDGVGAKGIGENDLAAGFSVGAGYGFNAIGMGEIPGVGFDAGGQAAGL